MSAFGKKNLLWTFRMYWNSNKLIEKLININKSILIAYLKIRGPEIGK
jgi:hypothetical protein